MRGWQDFLCIAFLSFAVVIHTLLLLPGISPPSRLSFGFALDGNAHWHVLCLAFASVGEVALPIAVFLGGPLSILLCFAWLLRGLACFGNGLPIFFCFSHLFCISRWWLPHRTAFAGARKCMSRLRLQRVIASLGITECILQQISLLRLLRALAHSSLSSRVRFRIWGAIPLHVSLRF